MTSFTFISRYAVLIAMVSPWLAAQPTPVTFYQAPNIALPSSSNSTFNQAAGRDLNRDGNLDLVVGLGNSIGVFLGSHSGKFSGPVVYAAGGPILGLAVADFNGDGKLDVMVLSIITAASSWELELFPGNGDGTLAPYSVAAADSNALSGLIVSDFNHDGKADLATLSGSTVIILLGDGNGKFRRGMSLSMPTIGCWFSGLVAAPLKSGANVSLAVTCGGTSASQDYVAIFGGNGNGTFQSAVTIPFAAVPNGLALADLNNDGNADLIFPNEPPYNSGPSSTTVMLGHGDGTFGPAQNFVGQPYPAGVMVADANNDGKPDVIVMGGGGVTSVYLGNGDGTLQPGIDYASGAFPEGIVSGDFNRDGHTDFAVLTATALTLLFGKPDGTLAAPHSFGSLGQDDALVTADFNGDGKLDIATSALSVLLGNGDGTFQPAQPLPSNGTFTTSIATADLNRDGIPDLLADSQVFLGNGDGTFRELNTQISGTGYAIADFNADGIPDVVATTTSSYQVLGTLTVALGKGDGTFGKAKLIQAVNIGGFENPVAADLNGDGKMDLVVFSGSPAALMLYYPGNGDGTFQPAVTVEGGGSDLHIADINRDGKLDVIMLSNQGGLPTITVRLGNGNGTFQTPLVSSGIPSLANSPKSFVLADLNGDGTLDIAFTDANAGVGPFPSDVRVAYGNGDGTFTFSTVNFLSGSTPWSIVAGRFSGGAHPDLAIANAGGSSVWLLRNTTK